MRLKGIIYFIIAICILLLVRVYYLSIKSNTYYEQLSEKNYIKTEFTTAPRGAIIDRNGDYMALNKIGFSITVKPHMRKRKTLQELENIFILIEKHFPEYSYEKLYKRYKRLDSVYKHDYINLVEYIAYDDFFKYYSIFNSNEYIKIKSATKRFYPYQDVGAHLIGYTGRTNKRDIKKDENQKYYEIIGRSGLESYYNKQLQGTLGEKTVKVNAIYKVIDTLEEKLPMAKDIHTTVDMRLQKYIHEIFNKSKHKAGAVIVMDAHSGELLAGGSFPEFDNNIFVNGISHKDWQKIRNDFNHPFSNKLVNGKYPPGSVMKMGVAISFLENGLSPYFSVDCNASMRLGQRNFRCWKEKGHKRTGFRKAIRESCDDFFYKGSLKVGIDNIHKTLDRFGFGQVTGVDQPNESVGINPSREWKRRYRKEPWYPGNTVISSIGQGDNLVTPMQVARYTASLATGKLPRPHFLKDDSMIEHIDVNVSKRDMKIIRQGMYDVTNRFLGTAVNYVKSSKVKMAGKTGTAQVVGIPQSEKKRMKEHELKYFKRSHAWLTTYAPYKNPQYVVTIIVEHGGHGGSAAGAMVAKIYNKLAELGYIKVK
jgi:penicillin-binding protein 2